MEMNKYIIVGYDNKGTILETRMVKVEEHLHRECSSLLKSKLNLVSVAVYGLQQIVTSELRFTPVNVEVNPTDSSDAALKDGILQMLYSKNLSRKEIETQLTLDKQDFSAATLSASLEALLNEGRIVYESGMYSAEEIDKEFMEKLQTQILTFLEDADLTNYQIARKLNEIGEAPNHTILMKALESLENEKSIGSKKSSGTYAVYRANGAPPAPPKAVNVTEVILEIAKEATYPLNVYAYCERLRQLYPELSISVVGILNLLQDLELAGKLERITLTMEDKARLHYCVPAPKKKG